jgi:hypothetical protein
LAHAARKLMRIVTREFSEIEIVQESPRAEPSFGGPHVLDFDSQRLRGKTHGPSRYRSCRQLILFFPVMVNVLTAIRGVDPDLINLARSFQGDARADLLENRVSDLDASDVRRTAHRSDRRLPWSASSSASW